MPRSWPQPFTSRPSTSTRPPLAVSSPMTMRSAVVLPQPDGPISETISPSRTVKLTSLSAFTIWTLPSTRSVKRFDTPTRLTSPKRYPPKELGPDALEGFSAQPIIDGLLDAADLGDLAQLEELPLHPDELVHRYRKVRLDGAGRYGVVEGKGRPRIVRLGAGHLLRHLDVVVTMGDGETERADLGHHE